MAGRKREPLRPVEHAIVTGAAAWRDRVRFEPPCYALRNTEGRIMDRAQIASEYRKSSQTCLLRAKRATIPLIGQSSQGSGEALARLYDDMSPISHCAPSLEEHRGLDASVMSEGSQTKRA
jgi:hypothetical protein